MAANKVVINGVTHIDLTQDTVTPGDLPPGIKAHSADGASIVGTGANLPTGYAAIGTVIYHAGTTAPVGYLACDGGVYNIADYPDLAAFFETNYGASNYWGGDGETTFAVPDWQGEFFRAAGTNSRDNQGSGADVGVHQDATTISAVYFQDDATLYMYGINSNSNSIQFDKHQVKDSTGRKITTSSRQGGENTARGTVRPTSTSLLVCIKALLVDNMAEVVAAVLAALPQGEEMSF